MKSITEFERNFSRVARGYAPEEVDAAIRMLVDYGAELESANAEFAEVNEELIAQNDRLTAEKTEAEAALAALRTRLDEAESTIAALRAAPAAADDSRYAALCRETRSLGDALRALCEMQLPALEALMDAPAAPTAAVETPAPAAPVIDIPVARPVPAPAEPEEAATTTFTIPTRRSGEKRIRRVAMAAAAVEPEAALPADETEPPVRPTGRRPVAEPSPDHVPAPAPRRAAQTPPPAKPAPAAIPEESVFLPPIDPVTKQEEPDFAAIWGEAPTRSFDAIADEPIADGVELKSVYRPFSPADLKAKGKTTLDTPASDDAESFAAVRLTLEKIERNLDDED